MLKDPLQALVKLSASRRSPLRRSRLLDWAVTGLILAVLALLAARLDRVPQEPLTGRASVIDGDSLRLSGFEIRLVGIDAPERDQTCLLNSQAVPCGRAASDRLKALASSSIRCEPEGRDRYDRLLATCFAGETEINRRLVAEGWAVAYGRYRLDEARARLERRGLWSMDFDQPRDWRDANK